MSLVGSQVLNSVDARNLRPVGKSEPAKRGCVFRISPLYMGGGVGAGGSRRKSDYARFTGDTCL